LTHVRSFWGDYWRAIVGVLAWLVLMGTCFVVPIMFTYWYALIWAGAGASVAALFVGGYLRFSKPTKDPVTRKRKWSGEWVWLLAQAVIVLLVVGMNFTLRMMNVETAIFTDDRVEQYRATAAVFVTVFMQQLWLLWMWFAQQVQTRRELRVKVAAEAAQADGVR
jgi:magnesium-transporting ATPase (P-type)